MNKQTTDIASLVTGAVPKAQVYDVLTPAMEYFEYMRGIIGAIETLCELPNQSDRIKDLAKLGSYIAADAHNTIDVEMERLIGNEDSQ